MTEREAEADHIRRVALIIDVSTASETESIAFDHTTRGWITHLAAHLSTRDISAVPVRIDIDGRPRLLR